MKKPFYKFPCIITLGKLEGFLAHGIPAQQNSLSCGVLLLVRFTSAEKNYIIVVSENRSFTDNFTMAQQAMLDRGLIANAFL